MAAPGKDFLSFLSGLGDAKDPEEAQDPKERRRGALTVMGPVRFPINDDNDNDNDDDGNDDSSSSSGGSNGGGDGSGIIDSSAFMGKVAASASSSSSTFAASSSSAASLSKASVKVHASHSSGSSSPTTSTKASGLSAASKPSQRQQPLRTHSTLGGPMAGIHLRGTHAPLGPGHPPSSFSSASSAHAKKTHGRGTAPALPLAPSGSPLAPAEQAAAAMEVSTDGEAQSGAAGSEKRLLRLAGEGQGQGKKAEDRHHASSDGSVGTPPGGEEGQQQQDQHNRHRRHRRHHQPYQKQHQQHQHQQEGPGHAMEEDKEEEADGQLLAAKVVGVVAAQDALESELERSEPALVDNFKVEADAEARLLRCDAYVVLRRELTGLLDSIDAIKAQFGQTA